jgi:hypothetical protein
MIVAALVSAAAKVESNARGDSEMIADGRSGSLARIVRTKRVRFVRQARPENAPSSCSTVRGAAGTAYGRRRSRVAVSLRDALN